MPCKGFLEEEKLVQLTKMVGEKFQKVTFAGGEPTICHFLPRLLSVAHEEGAMTNIVTNGSRIDEKWIAANGELIDLLTISIDSDNPDTHRKLGRCLRGAEKPCNTEHYLKLAEACRKNNVSIKMNTVVTEVNKHENISNFVAAFHPTRWKILQAMAVKGQNDEHISQLTPSLEDFNHYVECNKMSLDSLSLIPKIRVVPEPIEESIIGSYIMVDPLGRFIDDSKGCNTYSSRTIFEVGVDAAFAEMAYDLHKFQARGGTADFAYHSLAQPITDTDAGKETE